MTRLLTIINLLSICFELIVGAQEAPPALPKTTLRKQSFLKALFNPRPQFTTTRLTVDCADVPGAVGYFFYFSTRENFFEPGDVVTELNSSRTFTFTNSWGQRPPRWFFGVSAFKFTDGGQVWESELSYCHWPPYPPILDRVRISWEEANTVTIETCADYFEPYALTNGTEVEWIYPNWTPLPPVNGTELTVPYQPGNHFFRDAAGVLSLQIEPVFKPDPRDNS